MQKLILRRTTERLCPWVVFSGDQIKFLTFWKSSRFGIGINPLQTKIIVSPIYRSPNANPYSVKMLEYSVQSSLTSCENDR